MFRRKYKALTIVAMISLIFAIMLSACSTTQNQKDTSSQQVTSTGSEGGDSTSTAPTEQAEASEEKKEEEIVLTARIALDKSSGPVRTVVQADVTKLMPNTPFSIMWDIQKGMYELDGIYGFIGLKYEFSEAELVHATSDADGAWSGEIIIPEGYGGDHVLTIVQDGKKVGQANFLVDAVFSIYPPSGPVGTEITVVGEGLGWRDYGSIWHLNYDNSYMGMITAVSTNGKAVAKIRAAGNVGKHYLTFESAAHGLPYLNRLQSPINTVKTQFLEFEITSGEPVGEITYTEEVPPSAAGGGIHIPPAQNEAGVTVTLDKGMGIVGAPIVMDATGLPANETFEIIWHTMKGNRVSGQGFGEVTSTLAEVKSDGQGKLTFHFSVPDDLGGAPHLIDIALNGEVYGQTYLKILPSVHEVSPPSGPAGTVVQVTLKGVGWTEFDNSMFATYDNTAVGYMCGFNSQGTVTFPIVASGAPGWHLIDIYPGIYKGQKQFPNVYIKPQLTYYEDHPGTAIPALRIGFEVTE